MPSSPDRPDGRPPGPDEDEAPEAAPPAVRNAVPPPTSDTDRPTKPVDRGRRPADRAREDRARDDRARDDRARDDRVRDDRAGDDRRTVPVGPRRADARETVPVEARGDARRTERIDPGGDPRRATVLLDGERRSVGDRETVLLPGPRRGPAAPVKRAPIGVAAAFATLWAALWSYLPVAAVVGVARTFEGAGGLGGAAKGGLAAWLLGHGVPLGTSIGPLTLTPLLLTLLALWRLNRAGLHVTRAIGARHRGSIKDAAVVAGAIGTAYAILGFLAALIANGPGLTVSAPRAAWTFFLVGVAGAGLGAVRGTDAIVVLARRLPAVLRHALRTGVVAALLIVAAGAILTGLAVAVRGGEAASMISAYRTGVAGQAGITLISLAFGGNGAIWSAAYLLGPGFAVGTGTAIRLTEVTIGPLPALPLLAGLPSGPIGATGALVLAIPVLAGLAAGWALTRRLVTGRPPPGAALTGPDGPAPARTPGWSLVLTSAVFSGPAAGLVLGGLAWLSGGALGGGRLATIGPVPWLVAAVAAAVVTVSATIGAATARAFRNPPR